MTAVMAVGQYPCKGFAGTVTNTLGFELPLEKGKGLPKDRVFAFATPNYVGEGRWAKKQGHFHTAMTLPRMARRSFEILPNGNCRIGKEHVFHPQSLAEISGAESWVQSCFDLPDKPKFVRAVEGAVLTDMQEPLVSIINPTSASYLLDMSQERFYGDFDVFLNRFRGNVLLKDVPAWAENDWVGKTLSFTGGLQLQVVDHIGRCAATHANPSTGEADINMCEMLINHHGRRGWKRPTKGTPAVMGVYARVVKAGLLVVGRAFTVQ